MASLFFFALTQWLEKKKKRGRGEGGGGGEGESQLPRAESCRRRRLRIDRQPLGHGCRASVVNGSKRLMKGGGWRTKRWEDEGEGGQEEGAVVMVWSRAWLVWMRRRGTRREWEQPRSARARQRTKNRRVADENAVFYEILRRKTTEHFALGPKNCFTFWYTKCDKYNSPKLCKKRSQLFQ